MAKKLKGTDLKLYRDPSTELGGQKSFDYTLKSELVDTTCTEDGDWTSFLPVGGKVFSATLDQFLTNDTSSFNYLQNCWLNDTSVGISIKPTTASDTSTWNGAVWVNDIKISGAGKNKEMISASMTLQGTGKWTLK